MDSPRTKCILTQATVDSCGAIETSAECNNHANCTYASSSSYCNAASTTNECLSQSGNGGRHAQHRLGVHTSAKVSQVARSEIVLSMFDRSRVLGFGFRPDIHGSFYPLCETTANRQCERRAKSDHAGNCRHIDSGWGLRSDRRRKLLSPGTVL